jgi:hypothetical protein
LSPLEAFLREQHPAVLVEPDGRQSAAAAIPAAVLPGSFNPLHAGHLGLAAAAGQILKMIPHFELSVCNADKPPLSPDEVRRRLRQFAWRHPLWLTHAPTFAEKAQRFPGCVFVVGADTAERVVAPRFYAGGDAGLRQALDVVLSRGCRFLVAARRVEQGRLLTLGDVAVPAPFAGLFIEIPVAEFHMPISSTELRRPVATGQCHEPGRDER